MILFGLIMWKGLLIYFMQRKSAKIESNRENPFSTYENSKIYDYAILLKNIGSFPLEMILYTYLYLLFDIVT